MKNFIIARLDRPGVIFELRGRKSRDPDRLKLGFYAFSSDYLNRYSLFGGIVVNKRLERDAFLSFEYRDKLPLIYNLGLKPQLSLELYSVSRKTDVDIFFGEYTDSLGNTQYDFNTNTDVTYDLFDIEEGNIQIKP